MNKWICLILVIYLLTLKRAYPASSHRENTVLQGINLRMEWQGTATPVGWLSSHRLLLRWDDHRRDRFHLSLWDTAYNRELPFKQTWTQYHASIDYLNDHFVLSPNGKYLINSHFKTCSEAYLLTGQKLNVKTHFRGRRSVQWLPNSLGWFDYSHKWRNVSLTSLVTKHSYELVTLTGKAIAGDNTKAISGKGDHIFLLKLPKGASLGSSVSEGPIDEAQVETRQLTQKYGKKSYTADIIYTQYTSLFSQERIKFPCPLYVQEAIFSPSGDYILWELRKPIGKTSKQYKTLIGLSSRKTCTMKILLDWNSASDQPLHMVAWKPNSKEIVLQTRRLNSIVVQAGALPL